MSTTNQYLWVYTEPCGLLGLIPSPPNGSTDNGLLFTATARMLDPEHMSQAEYEQLALSCEVAEGCFSRWPLVVKEPEVSNWDDHIAVSFASPLLAKRVLAYGRVHRWTWNGEFLARIVDFSPAVTMAAGESAGWFGRGLAILGLLANIWEPRGATSGKCLLVLKCRIYDRCASSSALLEAAVRIWRNHMRRLYGDLGGLYEIYYGKSHPLTRLAYGRDF